MWDATGKFTFGLKWAKSQCHCANNSVAVRNILCVCVCFDLRKMMKWCRYHDVKPATTHIYNANIYNLTFHILHTFSHSLSLVYKFPTTYYFSWLEIYSFRYGTKCKLYLKTPEVMQNIYFIEKSIPVALIHLVGWAHVHARNKRVRSSVCVYICNVYDVYYEYELWFMNTTTMQK